MALKINVDKAKEGVFVVSAAGSIDTETSAEMEKTLSPILAIAKAIVLNMEGVDYISSMGISVIFNSKKAIEAKGGSFLMTNLQPQIKRTFEIINALPKMCVFGSLQEADAYLLTMQRKEIEKQKNN